MFLFVLQSYVWVSVPLIIYLGDVMYRMIRRSNSAQIVGSVCYADNVIELKMIKDGFKADPGQVGKFTYIKKIIKSVRTIYKKS